MRLISVLVLASLMHVQAGEKKALTLSDMMRFRQIGSVVMAEDGKWVAYTANPDRGDGVAIVRSTASSREFRIPRGAAPVFSMDSQWLAVQQLPPALELEKHGKDKTPPAAGMVLLNLETGDTVGVGAIASFSFANNGRWFAYLKKKNAVSKETANDSTAGKGLVPVELVGTDLTLRDLQSTRETTYAFTRSFAFDSLSQYLAFATGDTAGVGNELCLVDLIHGSTHTVDTLVRGLYTNLSWNNASGRFACVRSVIGNDGRSSGGSLLLWSPGAETAVEGLSSHELPEHWEIPSTNKLVWSNDGALLYLGLKPEAGTWADTSVHERRDAFFDIDSLRSKREVDVWNWIDPLIIPHQKKRWKEMKDQTFTSVVDPEARHLVQLADSAMPYVNVPDNPFVALGHSDLPYQQEISWEAPLSDYYVIRLGDGSRKRFVEKQGDAPSLSPSGKYVVYYREKEWYLYDIANDRTRVLTDSLGVPFYNTLNDLPAPPGGFGIGGWGIDDRSVFINDMFDIWQFPTDGGKPLCVTGGNGRKREVRYRIINQHPDAPGIADNERLLLSAYSEREKNSAFYGAQSGQEGVRALIDEPARYTFLGKAKRAPVIMFTRETYSEFPDIWVSPPDLTGPGRISDVNPQVSDFAWGKAELVSWNSVDGVPLQGVLIKPGNYEPGKRYPVLVYFYELSSQLLHVFNRVEINHRPCLPYYASNGYAVFLPDVRYTVGEPGFSATKCVVPGVQKLIAMGIADPGAIALHGHSWGGYETAFMVTQTSMFAAAIAGAPVANMTSAYDGIRWESGLSRQFQYEQIQSRIGGSLWERRDRFIENSPVFYADRITTPLLIEFGDEDGAVPWYQGIEMYLAMRRLGKESYFLQYRGEPHHLKKYPNKVDYTIRFREFLDHFLKGAPAPDWMTKGVPYSESPEASP